MRALSAAVLFILSTVVIPASVSAAPVTATPAYCGDQSVLSVTDVTFRGAAANDCYGMASGNDNLAAVNALNGFGAADWEASLKNEGSATLNYKGLTWTLSAPKAVTGPWTLGLSDPLPVSLPVQVDMLVVLKGGNGWAAYFFDNQAFYTNGSSAGEFAINFLNGGGNTPALSHMTIYFRDGGTPPEPCAAGTCEEKPVPEPASVALLGLGMLGAAFFARRR